jgi:hypothetical protein
MNDQLQQSLALILGKATDAVTAGVGFLQAELPDVVRQLLLWKLTSSLIFGFLGLFVFLAIAILGTQQAISLSEKEAKKAWGEPGMVWFGFAFAGGIPMACAAITAMANLGTALQIWLAPKIYLIEFAAKMVK